MPAFSIKITRHRLEGFGGTLADQPNVAGAESEAVQLSLKQQSDLLLSEQLLLLLLFLPLEAVFSQRGFRMTPILQEHKAFLKNGGIFENAKTFIKVSGPDSVDFLHRITSQDIKNLISGNGERGALLDPAGLILALFEIYNCGQFFLLVVDKAQGAVCLENLERLHFSEDLKINDVSEDFHFMSVQGKFAAREILQKIFGKLPRRGEVLGVEEALVAFSSDFENNVPGYHFFIKSVNLEEIKAKLQDSSFEFLSLELWSLLRIESGHFSFGKDITEKNMILEATLDGYVAHGKGCYPGQEVVERVFTYGTIAKKLMGLKLETQELKLEGRAKLLDGADDAGYVTSVHKMPWSNEIFAFGIVRKPRYQPGQKLVVENTQIQAEVKALPGTFDIKKPV